MFVTALLRDARGVAAPNVPLTLVVERPDGVDYRRVVVPDQGLGGRSLTVPIISTASTGTWRVRAFTDPKRPAIGETTFMVEDYVPDRVEFDLASAGEEPRRAAARVQVSVDGRFFMARQLPRSNSSGAMVITAAKERPGFAGYSFGLADDEVTAARQELADLPRPMPMARRRSRLHSKICPRPRGRLRRAITVSMAESGGRAVERKLTLPITPEAAMIGVKPAFSGRSLADGANADFDVVMAAPDGATLNAKV